MEFVKANNENKMHTNITIKGTYDNPLFRASDIGEVLEISFSIKYINLEKFEMKNPLRQIFIYNI